MRDASTKLVEKSDVIKSIDIIFVDVNLFWAQLTLKMSPDPNPNQNIFISETIKTIAIIITWWTIDKVKTETNDQKTDNRQVIVKYKSASDY